MPAAAAADGRILDLELLQRETAHVEVLKALADPSKLIGPVLLAPAALAAAAAAALDAAAL